MSQSRPQGLQLVRFHARPVIGYRKPDMVAFPPRGHLDSYHAPSLLAQRMHHDILENRLEHETDDWGIHQLGLHVEPGF